MCLSTCCDLFRLAQVEDLKAKLAVQEVELWQRNTDIEALIAKIGQQTDKLNQERTVADAEEQKVPVCSPGVSVHDYVCTKTEVSQQSG